MTDTIDSTVDTSRDRRATILRRAAVAAICGITAVLAVVLVGGGRAPKSVSMSANTADYRVGLDLDAASLGRRAVTIRVDGTDGRPVAPADVDVRTSMRSMHMDGVQLAARPTGPGRYEAGGDLFPMLGEWSVVVRISRPGSAAQEAVFTVTAVP